MPVPVNAPAPKDHFRLGAPTKRWAYRDANGLLLGYVARFDLGRGKKEIIPQIFTKTGWKWKSFPKPRPLLNLEELAQRPDAPVLVVEGEGCVDAARRLMPAYVAVTWSGGGKAAHLADWTPVHGRRVLMWPDRDRHKYKAMHPLAGEEMAYDEQAGIAAMNRIGGILENVCPEIKILNTAEFRKDGHDIADCEKEGAGGQPGWDDQATLIWARQNVKFWSAPPAGQISTNNLTAQQMPTHLKRNVPEKDFSNLAQLIIEHVYVTGNGPLKHYSSCWYRWNGSHYPEIEMSTIRRDVYRFLNTCCIYKGGLNVDLLPDRDYVSKVIDALAAKVHLENHYKAPAWISGQGPDPKNCTVLQNGVLELHTRRLHRHTPDFWTHNCVPFDYEPLAPPPIVWMGFLASCWPIDAQSIDTLQEIFGYCLTSDTSLQKIFMLIGPKRSGKGTIGRILKALLGRENTCEPTLDSLRNDFGLEQLIGKMLAVFTDVRLEGQTAAITEHLLSISGEDAKSINRKNLKHWNGQLIARFFMFTNIIPRFGDSSSALASRFIILQMLISHLGKEDITLTEKLLDELPGIFNWSLDGLDRLRRRGKFVMPISSSDKLKEFEELSAPILGFLRDSCVVKSGVQIECTVLFNSWVSWCRDQGRDGHGTLATFSRDLKAQEPSITTGNTRDWQGAKSYFVGVAPITAVENAGMPAAPAPELDLGEPVRGPSSDDDAFDLN